MGETTNQKRVFRQKIVLIFCTRLLKRNNELAEW